MEALVRLPHDERFHRFSRRIPSARWRSARGASKQSSSKVAREREITRANHPSRRIVMSIERFVRQIKWVMSSALLAAGFAGCSGGSDDPVELANEPNDSSESVKLANEPSDPSESVELTSDPMAPNADESVAVDPPFFCNGCFINDDACAGQLAPGCFCTVDFDCCRGFPPIAMVCGP
jgi:hypothetical protein